MSLKSLLSSKGGKMMKSVRRIDEISRSEVRENLDQYRDIVSYWRMYPDKMVDWMCGLNPNNTFKLYFSQRLLLRLMLRCKTLFAVFSRGFSKSFLAVLALTLKCILYPRAQLCAVSDGKTQSAAIVVSKLTELCQMIPALKGEIEWDTRGKISQTKQSRDTVRFAFKNGSTLENAPMTDTTRGRRFQGLLVEEAATVDQDRLNEIIMPTLVISRTVNGHADPDEVLNQSAMFVTSAGWKNTYSYNKMIQTLCEMVVDPRKSFLIGGDYKIPVVEGLQPANFIQSQELDVSVSEDGFDREYRRELYSLNMINCWKPLKAA